MNCPTSARAISLSSAITPVGRCGECASAGVNMKSARPAFAPLFFQACAVSLGMNAHVPALPRETESPILKEKSPLKTHMASSLV
jgi:hypothetical protein